MAKTPKQTFSLKRKTTGKVTPVKGIHILDAGKFYAIVQEEGYVKSAATLFEKELWEWVDGIAPEHKEEPPADAPTVEEPVAEPEVEEEPVPKLTPEIIAEIESGAPSEKAAGGFGDLNKDSNPHEYNVWAPHDKIGAKELLGMKAHVESNYAIAEGERKIKQAMAKRDLIARVERVGVGFVPE